MVGRRKGNQSEPVDNLIPTMEQFRQLERTMNLANTKITELHQDNIELRKTIDELKATSEQQCEILRQLINDAESKFIVETARQDRLIKNITESPERVRDVIHRPQPVEINMPTFSGERPSDHPKKFLKEINTYFTHKKIADEDKILVIENCLQGKAAKWFGMIKDATPNEETFKGLFLKHFFSENTQWEIFIKCTEAGKRPIRTNYQEHFHYWMSELRFLDSPKLNEDQAINLIAKHFPIAIQAYIQTTQERKFIDIWEKLGELENNDRSDRQNIKTGGSGWRRPNNDQIPIAQINNRQPNYLQPEKKAMIKTICIDDELTDGEVEGSLNQDESKNEYRETLETEDQ